MILGIFLLLMFGVCLVASFMIWGWMGLLIAAGITLLLFLGGTEEDEEKETK